MNSLIDMPPRTAMEVFKMLPEGTLAEVIDNQLYMSPSPVFNHQDILMEIASQLRSALKSKARIAISPFDVYLDEISNAVQPDIVVILNENPGKLKRHFHGVPDLLVEILSPGNRDHDTVVKKNLYEKFGVREYWIVDPESKHVDIYTLDPTGHFQLAVSAAGTVTSPTLNIMVAF